MPGLVISLLLPAWALTNPLEMPHPLLWTPGQNWNVFFFFKQMNNNSNSRRKGEVAVEWNGDLWSRAWDTERLPSFHLCCPGCSPGTVVVKTLENACKGLVGSLSFNDIQSLCKQGPDQLNQALLWVRGKMFSSNLYSLKYSMILWFVRNGRK